MGRGLGAPLRRILAAPGILLFLCMAQEPRAVPGVVADPMMPFSTYLGGDRDDFARAVAVGPDGTVWVAGFTYSRDFPGVPTGIGADIYPGPVLVHIDPVLHVLLSSLPLQAFMVPRRLAVDAGGNVFILGTGGGTNLPGATGFQPASAGEDDLVLLKVASDGETFLWSSYLGGTGGERAGGIAVDGNGDAVVAGTTWSSDFPTVDAMQPGLLGSSDAFVARFLGDGSGLAFSTYLGGSGVTYLGGSGGESEGNVSVAIAGDGGILVSGTTMSDDFPLIAPLQAVRAGGTDAFLARLVPTGSTVSWSTLLGGGGRDASVAVAVDQDGSVVLLGETESGDFPAPAGATWSADGKRDLFLARFAGDGSSMERSLRFGGRGNDVPLDLALAPDGTAWVAGETSSDDLPTAGSVRCRFGYGVSAFAAGFDLEAGALLFSTYLGGDSFAGEAGVALGPDDAAWIVGGTLADTFPMASPLQPGNSGAWDMFVTRLTRTSPELRPASPAGPEVEALSGHAARIRWEDRSADETGFAVDRMGDYYGFDRVAVIPEGSTEFDDTDLLPARTYTYSVQSFNEDGGSLPTDLVSVAMPPTLDFQLLRWNQRLIRWSGTHRLRFMVSLPPGPDAEAGRLDPVGGGLEVRIESEEYTGFLVVHSIPPDDPNWKRSGGRLRWRPPDAWMFRVDVDLRRHRILVRGLTSDRLPITIPDQDVRMRVTVGRDAGAGLLPWPVNR